ncbi:MAG: lysophospholipid acyltransferase family protein [Candidatus Aminicenantaceae bacterium]
MFLYVVIAILAIPVLLICGIFRWLPPIVFVGRSGVRLGRSVLGVKLEVSGQENVDFDQTYVYMPNHLSLVDGPMMFIVLPCFMRVIAKQEIFRIPFLGQAMRVAEFIPVDRKGREGGKKAIQRAVCLIREKGHSFLVFPEGTRSLDGQLQKFRRGGFHLALETGAPIVPISIIGSFELMPKGAFFTKRGTIKIKIHAPVSVEGHDVSTMPRLIETVREMVAAGIRDTVNPNLPLKRQE